jgi:WD40 repeat protein
MKKILFPKFTSKALTSCVFSPDEKTVFFGGKDHYIYQLDINSFNVIQKIKAHNESVTGIIFDKIKDQFYSVGNDKVLKVWSSDTNPAILLETFYGHTSQINNIKSIPGEINRYITTSLDGYINLWKVDSQSFLQFNTSNMYPIDCISPLTNDIFFTGNFNGSIQAWRTNKKKFVYSLNYSHGYEEKFNINHPFFDLNLKNKGPEVEVGKPVLSLESPAFSDLLISGSINGEINFYKVDKEGNNINIEIKNKMNIKNKGCLNVIKFCQDKKFIVVGNGTDNKFGRWNKEYDNKLGITIVKLEE